MASSPVITDHYVRLMFPEAEPNVPSKPTSRPSIGECRINPSIEFARSYAAYVSCRPGRPAIPKISKWSEL